MKEYNPCDVNWIIALGIPFIVFIILALVIRHKEKEEARIQRILDKRGFLFPED